MKLDRHSERQALLYRQARPHTTERHALLVELSRQFNLPLVDVSALPSTLPRSLAETVWADDAPEVMIVDWVGGRWIFIA